MFLFKMIMSLLVVATMAMADNGPTVQEIYKTAQGGDINKAHQMIEEVLKSHPQSAKAHFVDAEILVRQNDLVNAKKELDTAEKLAPGLPFAKPESVTHLKQHLGASSAPVGINTIKSALTQNSNIPWNTILLGGLALMLIWFVMRSLTSRNTGGGYHPQQGSGGAPVGPNLGGSQPYPPQSGGSSAFGGGGIMSGLATGAAAGAGFAAGEELIRHFTEGSSDHTAPTSITPPTPSVDNTQSNYDMGGDDFGLDDSSSWDDDSLSSDNW